MFQGKQENKRCVCKNYYAAFLNICQFAQHKYKNGIADTQKLRLSYYTIVALPRQGATCASSIRVEVQNRRFTERTAVLRRDMYAARAAVQE